MMLPYASDIERFTCIEVYIHVAELVQCNSVINTVMFGTQNLIWLFWAQICYDHIWDSSTRTVKSIKLNKIIVIQLQPLFL